MAEKSVNVDLEEEVIEIFKHIENEDNFLLSGGAGSGKTYSLVETIKEIFRRNPNFKIACITFTNVAVDEINDRISNRNLKVSTIHSFLWDTINSFEIPLKKSLLELINNENSKIKKPDSSIEGEYYNDFENGISYNDFNDIESGKISHDEIIELSNYMFKKYKLLCDIFKDKYDFVFIDEYQDTHKAVIDIFLNHLNKSDKKCIIGFFGDSMQSIYDNRIGDLNEYNNFKEVKKKQNRRNPLKVINLANKLRIDDLKQEPSKDLNAPNIDDDGNVKNGSIKFLYSSEDLDINKIKKSVYFKDWNFRGKNESKELYLTHKLISKNANFQKLLEIYDNDEVSKLIRKVKKKISANGFDIDENKIFKEIIQEFGFDDELNDLNKENTSDMIINSPFKEIKSIKSKKEMLEKVDNMDEILLLLYKAMKCLYFYENNDIIKLMKELNKYFEINTVAKKKEIKDLLNEFSENKDKFIEEVIITFKDIFGQNDILKSTKNKYYFERIRHLNFLEFRNLFYYLEGYTPDSTQHNVKGEEYENVFIILDNGKWSKYNFNYLLSNNTENKRVLERTKKLFYVCCTRTKENLAVFYPKPDNNILKYAKEFFGEENVHEI